MPTSRIHPHPRTRAFIALFKATGWTQAEAARHLEITRGGVNGIIAGHSDASASLLKLLRLVAAPFITGSRSRAATRRSLSRAIPQNHPDESFPDAEMKTVMKWWLRRRLFHKSARARERFLRQFAEELTDPENARAARQRFVSKRRLRN